MKKHLKTTGMILALALALTLGVTALAENAEAPAAETPTADTTVETDTALQDALNALRTARNGDELADLETELKSYVEAGKLTQDQADLILKAYQDQESLRNGVCPNCGYQFSNGGNGRGGRMKNGNRNGFGGKGGKGGRGGRGGRGGFGRTQNGTQQEAMPDSSGNAEGSGI